MSNLAFKFSFVTGDLAASLKDTLKYMYMYIQPGRDLKFRYGYDISNLAEILGTGTIYPTWQRVLDDITEIVRGTFRKDPT